MDNFCFTGIKGFYAMREIAENIYCITEKFKWSMFKPPANIYIIASEKGIIFDSGYGTFLDKRFFRKEYLKVLEHINSRGRKFKAEYVIPSHSHGDHFSGLDNVRQFTGAKVCLTKLMAENISSPKNLINYHRISGSPVRTLWREERTKAAGRWDLFFPHLFGLRFLKDPDIIVKEYDTISDGEKDWKIIPVKGHCDDHIALFNEDTGVMFCGDNILQKIITWLGPPRSDIEKYCDSLKNILALKNLKLILPAHGRPVLDPKLRIKEILIHRRKKTKLVMDIIRDNGKDGIKFRSLRDKVYPPGTKPWIKSSGEGWILSTIEFLMKKRFVFLRETKDRTIIIPRDNLMDADKSEVLLNSLYDK